jgi:hypothetical protein
MMAAKYLPTPRRHTKTAHQGKQSVKTRGVIYTLPVLARVVDAF